MTSTAWQGKLAWVFIVLYFFLHFMINKFKWVNSDFNIQLVNFYVEHVCLKACKVNSQLQGIPNNFLSLCPVQVHPQSTSTYMHTCTYFVVCRLKRSQTRNLSIKSAACSFHAPKIRHKQTHSIAAFTYKYIDKRQRSLVSVCLLKCSAKRTEHLSYHLSWNMLVFKEFVESD